MVVVVLLAVRFVFVARCEKLRDCAVVAIVVETEAVPTLRPCWDQTKEACFRLACRGRFRTVAGPSWLLRPLLDLALHQEDCAVAVWRCLYFLAATRWGFLWNDAKWKPW